MVMGLDVSEADFERVVLDGSYERPVVVDFWAAWCGPCRTLGPMIERLADEYGVTLAKVDVDANQSLSAAFGIQSIPFVLAFKDGKIVDQFVGALPEQMVRQFMEGLQPSEADMLALSASVATDAGEQERLYRLALEQDRSHADAVMGLARIVGTRGDVDEARSLLSRLPATPDVERLRAELDLGASTLSDDELSELRAHVASDPFDEEALLRLGRAEAAAGRHREALQVLLTGVERGVEGAREAMLEVFSLLGDADPLTAEFRKRLAAALF
jgi:putative thioredoxin